MSSSQNIIENIQESPITAIVAGILSLSIVFGMYLLKHATFMQGVRDNIDDYNQKMILSLVVKNGEIQNTNSWSFSNVALYLLESFDMV
jgi:hypothetical protein